MKPARIVAAAILLASIRLSTALAQSTDLEPGVQTSDSSRPAAAQPPATPPITPTPQASQAPAPPQNPPPGSGAIKSGGKTQDRIELGTTQISGNRELPKVMYVVPWRKA